MTQPTRATHQPRSVGRMSIPSSGPAALELSLVVRTYNKCENIAVVLQRLARILARYKFEVIPSSMTIRGTAHRRRRKHSIDDWLSPGGYTLLFTRAMQPLAATKCD